MLHFLKPSITESTISSYDNPFFVCNCGANLTSAYIMSSFSKSSPNSIAILLKFSFVCITFNGISNLVKYSFKSQLKSLACSIFSMSFSLTPKSSAIVLSLTLPSKCKCNSTFFISTLLNYNYNSFLFQKKY